MSPVRSLLPRLPLVGAAFSLPLTAGNPALNAVDPGTRRGFRPLLVICALVSCLLALASPAFAKTAMQTYVDAMQPGWNLGNTLDATPDETSWGNPLTTQALIHQIKEQGFKSIRIPVSWDPHVGAAPTYTVDPAWMDRVQQIVDWSLAEGLYVMLNMHHDSYWIRERPANYQARFGAIWEQIAARFRDHSDKLMLETINEPDFLNVSDDATKIALTNELNTIAFNTIRASGGGNATRPIVMPTFVTNGSQVFLDGLKALMIQLNDPNLIATIHFYGYWPFSVNIAGVTTVDDSVLADIHNTFTHAHDTFVAAGIPVVVGELGILAWDTGLQGVERGELLKFFETVTATTKANGLTWQIWDNGKHFDRTGYFWKDPEQMGYILGGVTNRSSTGATDLIFVKDGAPADTAIPLNLNGNSFVSLTNGANTLTPGVDYTFDAGVLTVKASALAPYASGAFGEQAVFTANFSAGMPWKLHVRHLGVAALSAIPALKANKSGDVIISSAFNGDLVATMEAKYVNGDLPYPGQQNWTSFKEYTAAYLPSYGNNTLAIKKSFFDNTTNNPIELTFYFWSGRIEHYRLTFSPGGDLVPNPQTWSIYSDGLSGWNNWGSWAANNPDQTTVVHSGTKAISVDAGGYGALVLARNSWEPAVNTSAYKMLVFWIHGGTVGGQSLGVGVDWGLSWVGITSPAANTWKKYEIPLSAFGAEGKADITNVMVQNWSGASAPTFYIDDIFLSTGYPADIIFVNGSPAPVITSATTAAGVFNSSFSYTIVANNSPTLFSADNLPAWLALDAGSGVLSGTPPAAGSYSITVGATNASGSDTQTLAIEIAPAPATVALSNLTFTYDGAPKSPTVATIPSNLPVSLTFNGSADLPVNAGGYAVVATLTDPNYTATPATGTLIIQPFAATFTLPAGNSPFNAAINAAYDGAPQGVNPTTSPAGIPVTITYNGSTTVPALPGTYHVVVTSNDPNYTGTAEGTFIITVTALVRHAPALSGDVDGSMQLLSGESFAVNSGVAVSDLLVPGTPTVHLNGTPLFGGIVNASGATAPGNYSVTLNNGSVVRSVVRRVDPIAMPVVTAPALPVGTRSVTLTTAGQSIGAATTLRNLTLSASAGSVAVPAGVYGNFAVNGSNTLVLGVEGASVPAVYELQSLTISKNASVKIGGPVILKLASGLTLDGPLGSAAHPDWFDLRIATGGLTVNGGATVNGVITAPNGTVMINGTIHGRVNADRLTINGSGVLEDDGL
jgi:aryl-phospho-beta-D-glucosidase BglC (GH1 family)